MGHSDAKGETMALKSCRECGEKVSTTADTCPHCGTRNPTGKLLDTSIGGNARSCLGCIVLPILIVAVLAVVGMILGGL